MRFIARDATQCLLFSPVPGGWEVRIAHDEGYETVHLSTEQAWQIVELIHDCEAARKDGKLS